MYVQIVDLVEVVYFSRIETLTLTDEVDAYSLCAWVSSRKARHPEKHKGRP